MNLMPDMQVLEASALDKLDRIIATVASLDEDTANADLGVPGSNSPYQILRHCLTVVRYWTSTVCRGIEIPYDRAGDWTSSGPVAPLLELASQTRKAFVADLGSLDLDAPIASPPRHSGHIVDDTVFAVLVHVVEELAQHLGHLEITRDVLAGRGGVRQLRLVVEADDFDRAVGFYRDVVGLREEATYRGAGDERGVVLDAGRATLELNTPAQKRAIDLIEVGHPTDSPLRVAFEVSDAERATARLVDAGALMIAPTVTTPWSSLNSRLQAPGGLELTLFQDR